jgi:tetratricopeptide (TPR) repeat protein
MRRRRLRAFIQRFPYHIDSYHHLGIIETDLGRRARGLKYFEMGYRIGLRSIPEGFLGKLPWSHLPNRPFLRAAHGYGLGLERERRHLEAVEVYEQILQLNPADNLGIRYLLPSLYLKARAPQKARNVLEQHGSDGMNLFTRCLLEVQNGHHREAIRWLCRGLSYNPYLPEIILERKTDRPLHGARFVAMGSRQEAAEYLEMNSVWLRREARNFLRQLLDTKPFAHRIERAKELDAALDHDRKLPPGEARSAKVTERFALFDEQNILEILEECREMH